MPKIEETFILLLVNRKLFILLLVGTATLEYMYLNYVTQLCVLVCLYKSSKDV